VISPDNIAAGVLTYPCGHCRRSPRRTSIRAGCIFSTRKVWLGPRTICSPSCWPRGETGCSWSSATSCRSRWPPGGRPTRMSWASGILIRRAAPSARRVCGLLGRPARHGTGGFGEPAARSWKLCRGRGCRLTREAAAGARTLLKKHAATASPSQPQAGPSMPSARSRNVDNRTEQQAGRVGPTRTPHAAGFYFGAERITEGRTQ